MLNILSNVFAPLVKLYSPLLLKSKEEPVPCIKLFTLPPNVTLPSNLEVPILCNLYVGLVVPIPTLPELLLYILLPLVDQLLKKLPPFIEPIFVKSITTSLPVVFLVAQDIYDVCALFKIVILLCSLKSEPVVNALSKYPVSAEKLPATWSLALGLVVPIPTLPPFKYEFPAEFIKLFVEPEVSLICKLAFPTGSVTISNILTPPESSIWNKSSLVSEEPLTVNLALGPVVPIPTLPFTPSINIDWGFVSEPKLTSLVDVPCIFKAPARLDICPISVVPMNTWNSPLLFILPLTSSFWLGAVVPIPMFPLVRIRILSFALFTKTVLLDWPYILLFALLHCKEYASVSLIWPDATSSFTLGLAVPIPTLPELLLYILLPVKVQLSKPPPAAVSIILPLESTSKL